MKRIGFERAALPLDVLPLRVASGASIAPQLLDTNPSDDAGNVDPGAPIEFLFDTDVFPGKGVIEVRDSASDDAILSVDVTDGLVSFDGAVVTLFLPDPLMRAQITTCLSLPVRL